MGKRLETATFAAGCFWGVEERFRTVPGVAETSVGYAGGDTPHPTYEDVSSGKTGHAESVEVKYDPSIVSYEDLLNIFWGMHDSTRLDGQGPDIGTQYRSVIFYHTPEQEKIARRAKKKLDASGKYKNPVVTEIVPAPTFWRAEEYHQKYILKTGRNAC